MRVSRLGWGAEMRWAGEDVREMNLMSQSLSQAKAGHAFFRGCKKNCLQLCDRERYELKQIDFPPPAHTRSLNTRGVQREQVFKKRFVL